MIGRLKVWRGTYGFIEAEGKDYFTHRSQFIDEPRTDTYYAFDVADSDRRPGEKIATNVRSHNVDAKSAETEAAWAEHRRGPVQMGEDL